MNATKQDGERVRTFWNNHQMDVVRHEAISEDPRASVLEVAGEQGELHLTVAGREKDIFTIRTPLGDMIGESWEDAASVSRHIIE